MKKVKIDFDFSKWGQKGISVMSGKYRMLTLHKHPIVERDYYGMDYDCDFHTGDGFIMYQEVEPREVWINEFEYGLSNVYWFSRTLEEALESKILNGYKRTVKFREVLDDEQ